ncbi:hypothetical protein [Chloroflexus sp.]|uniref:hypothetical protein n=1 Tax=Chloroflexus sp. TaxID=1904827 RepID=UPI003C77CDF5
MIVHLPVSAGLRLREAACAADAFPLRGSMRRREASRTDVRSSLRGGCCMFTRLLKFLRRLSQIHPAVIAIAPDRTW